jgi:D-mannonate dehydratase
MLARHGLKVAALENLSPNFWSDILLDGPKKHAQIDGLKQLVRDAGRAGIPVIGYNFSIAGVWGWQRKRVARGGATTAVFFGDEVRYGCADPGRDALEHAVSPSRRRALRRSASASGISGRASNGS